MKEREEKIMSKRKNEDRVVAFMWCVDGDPWRVADTSLKDLKRYIDSKNEAINYLFSKGYECVDGHLCGRERQKFAVSGTIKTLMIVQNHFRGLFFAAVYGDGSVLSTDGLSYSPADAVDGKTDRERVLNRLHEFGF
jgi:hypothetical protein